MGKLTTFGKRWLCSGLHFTDRAGNQRRHHKSLVLSGGTRRSKSSTHTHVRICCSVWGLRALLYLRLCWRAAAAWLSGSPDYIGGWDKQEITSSLWQSQSAEPRRCKAWKEEQAHLLEQANRESCNGGAWSGSWLVSISAHFKYLESKHS